MINVVGSHELVHSGHVALDPHLLPPPAGQSLVLLFFVPHRSFLLFTLANAPFSSRGYAPYTLCHLEEGCGTAAGGLFTEVPGRSVLRSPGAGYGRSRPREARGTLPPFSTFRWMPFPHARNTLKGEVVEPSRGEALMADENTT